jgi:hypothetical protein
MQESSPASLVRSFCKDFFIAARVCLLPVFFFLCLLFVSDAISGEIDVAAAAAARTQRNSFRRRAERQHFPSSTMTTRRLLDDPS